MQGLAVMHGGWTYTAIYTMADVLLADDLSAEPSFAFNRMPQPAPASLSLPQESPLVLAHGLQPRGQQGRRLQPKQKAADGGSNSTDKADLHQAQLHSKATPQQLPASSARDASGLQQHLSSVSSQPNAWQGNQDYGQGHRPSHPASDTQLTDAGVLPPHSWKIGPSQAAVNADISHQVEMQETWQDATQNGPQQLATGGPDAAYNKALAAAYTPQELAAHLDHLKREFRQIYSAILDGDGPQSSQQEAAFLVSILVRQAGIVFAAAGSVGLMCKVGIRAVLLSSQLQRRLSGSDFLTVASLDRLHAVV